MGAAGSGTSLVLVVEIPPDRSGEEVRDDVAMTRRGQMADRVRRSVSAVGRVPLAGVFVELFQDRKGAGGIGAEGRPTGLPEPAGELG